MRLHVEGRSGQGIQGIPGKAGEEMSVCDECGSDRVEERWLTERFEHKDTTVEIEFRSMVCIDGAEANEALEEADRAYRGYLAKRGKK